MTRKTCGGSQIGSHEAGDLGSLLAQSKFNFNFAYFFVPRQPLRTLGGYNMVLGLTFAVRAVS